MPVLKLKIVYSTCLCTTSYIIVFPFLGEGGSFRVRYMYGHARFLKSEEIFGWSQMQ